MGHHRVRSRGRGRATGRHGEAERLRLLDGTSLARSSGPSLFAAADLELHLLASPQRRTKLILLHD